MKWPCEREWYALDPSALAKNWVQDSAGAQRRQLNNSKVTQLNAEGVNHLVGRQAQMICCGSVHAAELPAEEREPLNEFGFDDNVPNATERVMSVVMIPRHVEATDKTTVGQVDLVQEYSNGTTTNSIIASYSMVTAPVLPSQLIYARQYLRRGPDCPGRTNALIYTHNGARILDWNLREAENRYFYDDEEHEYVNPTQPVPGAEVVSNIADDTRTIYEAWRHASMPLVSSWQARVGTSGEYAYAPALSDGFEAFGIKVTAQTPVNVLATSVTSRTAWTPGFSSTAYKGGRGRSNTVPIVFGVLASCNTVTECGTTKCNAYVTLSGPIPPGSNITGTEAVKITSHEPEWFWLAPTNVALNAQAEDSDTTTARNKIDIMGSVEDNDYGALCIYAWEIRKAP